MLKDNERFLNISLVNLVKNNRPKPVELVENSILLKSSGKISDILVIEIEFLQWIHIFEEELNKFN